MGFIEDNSKWFFKRALFLWLPFAVIFLLAQKWRKGRQKKQEEEE